MPSLSSSEPRAPNLELDWEESLFIAIRGLVRMVRPSDGPGDAAAILADQRDQLATLARVASGLPCRIVDVGRDEGGVRDDDLLVPAWTEATANAAANAAILRMRVLLGAAMARELSDGHVVSPDADDFAAALALAARARDRLAGEWDTFLPAWEDVCRALLPTIRGEGPWQSAVRAFLLRQPIPGGRGALRRPPRVAAFPLVGSVTRTAGTLPKSGGEVPQPARNAQARPTTEMEGRAPTQVRLVELDPKKEQHLPVHVFEKVQTADTWSGVHKTPDVSDELEEHKEALDELDLQALVRGGDAAASVYRSDIRLSIDIPEVGTVFPGEKGIPYPEWDDRKKQLKPAWVTVYPAPWRARGDSWAAEVAASQRGLRAALLRRLVAERHVLRPRKRQADGEDIDLAAVVQDLADQQAGQPPSRLLYERRTRTARSIATTVLLDLSLSSDAWIEDRRVLDVAREALVLLGETTAVLGDDLQILAFASKTRNHVRMWEVKGWREPWNTARRKLGTLEPQGYTRIGPAIRHATAELGRSPARRRQILLLSDGKPTDFDRYEGNYGIRDVRHAVRDARTRGIGVFAFAIDRSATDYLPAMIGHNGWWLMRRPEALVDGLTRVYGRLTR